MQLSLSRPWVVSTRGLPLPWYRRLTAATAVAVWGLIVLGGMVRVTGSGMGCGASWPLCHGRLLPNLEYHELVEWNHRLFATLVGLLMIVTIGSTLLWYRRPRLVLISLLAAATYLAQAVLGGITVLLHLDHTWVAAHMGNSMLLLGSLTLLSLFARFPERGAAQGSAAELSVRKWGEGSIKRRDGKTSQAPAGELPCTPSTNLRTLRVLRVLAVATLAWTFVAMLTGSAVVGAEADLACPAWPQCYGGRILPATFEAWVSFGHRAAVGLSDVLMLALTVAVWRSRGARRLRTSAHLLALLYVSQVFLGAFTVWLGAPEALKGAHLALAAATWAALVALAMFVWVSAPSEGGPLGGGKGDVGVRGRPKGRSSIVPETLGLYIGLIKPRVIPLLLVPTVAAMLMAAAQQPTSRPLLPLILFTVLGGTLATAGAHAINQYLDRDIDAKMRRTRSRAVVTGRIPPRSALSFGVALTVLAVIQMWLTVNPLAALLALGGNLFYVFVYTLWLKRTSTQNIVIGGAAGAVPPLVGWAAVTGGLSIPALLFFAIIFFWTPAHFWALALVRQEDYRAAGVPMLPVVRGEAYTRAGILRYAILLLLVSLLPFATQSLSWLYLAAATSLGGLFVLKAAQLARQASISGAWRLFKFSNIYLALLYLAMVVDRLLALGGYRL